MPTFPIITAYPVLDDNRGMVAPISSSEFFRDQKQVRAALGLVGYLSHIVRYWPRDGGGRRPNGMAILQQDQPKFPKDSTVPTEVAQILLGTQFHKKKVTASCFEIAEVVAQHLKLDLSWDDDFALGAYLISCLLRAELYAIKNRKGTDPSYDDLDVMAYEYELKTDDQEILDYPELNTYTSHTPFPRWTNSVDDKGRKLIKPSTPQPKENITSQPFPEFESRKNDSTAFRLVSTKDQYLHVWTDNRDTITETIWIKAIHKLESNPYRINQDLLNVIHKVWDNKKTRPKKTKASLEKERQLLLNERSEIKSGAARDSDGGYQFTWEEYFPGADKDWRTIDNLNLLYAKQKDQDKYRRANDLPEFEDGDSRRWMHHDLATVRAAYWSRWYFNNRARNILASAFREFEKTKDNATILGVERFYQRAFLDHRGRIYLSKSKIHYQAGDMQRGLIEFADGKQLRKNDWQWLWLHLGNLSGEKGDAATRIKAAQKSKTRFLKWGKDPYKYYDEWKDESDKWQLMRACIELTKLTKNPKYKSTLIVEIDQSTSCLQHIAAYIGGDNGLALAKRVNLGSDYRDIYMELGKSLVEEEKNNYSELGNVQDKDLRKIIKMALVPWTYGGNAWTAGDAYHKSTIRVLEDMTSSRRMRFAHRVIAHIERELPDAVNYTQDVQRAMVGIPSWSTPSGFIVHASKHRQTGVGDEDWRHRYDDPRQRVYHKAGLPPIRIPAHKPLQQLDDDAIRKAVSPNTIHSYDASLIHHLLAACPDDITLVSVHDAIGTHARDMTRVRPAFKEIFHLIYSQIHPDLVAEKGFPAEFLATNGIPDQLSPELSEMILNAKHMTG